MVITTQFEKRLKSFIWRLGAYVIVSILGFIIANLGEINIPAYAITFVALFCGEITKYLNTKYSLPEPVE